MRWLYHIVPAGTPLGDPFVAPSLAGEGFIHASYRDEVRESAARYFPPGAQLSVLRIDPRRLDIPVEVVETPRGPMPHLYGPVPADAIGAVHGLDEFAPTSLLPDQVE